MTHPARPLAVTLVLAALALAAAGCSGPTSPSERASEPAGTRLSGRFNSGGGPASLSTYGQAAFEGITVEVEEDPAIRATVDANGSFTLRGLPQERFTLVFRNRDGQIIGEIEFDGLQPNLQITIVVELTGGGRVRLVSERRRGIGHGDLEIEGRVDEIEPGPHENEGTLVVNGYTAKAIPGVTTIREGNRARSMFDIRTGNRVHVKGVWDASGDFVVAHEIKLQGNDDAPGANPGNPGPGAECPSLSGGKVGQRIELEGTVASVNGGTQFMLRVNGNRAQEAIQVNHDGQPRCVGQAGRGGVCQVGAGDQVHVSGTLTSCTLVEASEVKIQKKGS